MNFADKNNTQIKSVIIGCSGHTGYLLSSPSLKRLDIVAVSFLPGEDGERFIKTLAAKKIYPQVFDDWHDMLKTVKPALAVVNPPFSLISEVSRMALLEGANVFSEKPAATTLEQLSRLEETFYQTKGLFIAGMFGMRCEPSFLTLNRLYQEGLIGKALLINAQKSYRMGERPDFYRRCETYGGLIPWIAIHPIDLIMRLSGADIKSISAAHSNQSNCGHGDMETVSLALYTLTNQTLASVTADMKRPDSAPTHGDDRLRVVGENGVLEFIGSSLTLNGGQPLPLDLPSDLLSSVLSLFDDSAQRTYESKRLFEATRYALLTRDNADLTK